MELFILVIFGVWTQVFVRHASTVQQDQIQYLNIDQNITALCNHPQHPAAVVLGTTSHLLIYDIAENKTIMSKEVGRLYHISLTKFEYFVDSAL